MSWMRRDSVAGVTFCDACASACHHRSRAARMRRDALDRVARRGDWRMV